MRYLLLVFLCIVVGVVAIAGWRGSLSRRPPIELFSDMVRQPKIRPQAESRLFNDGLGSQLAPAGTVARGSAWANNEYNTGKVPGTTNFVENAFALPSLALTAELLERGRERYTVHCSVCHGAVADGKGVASKPVYAMAFIANLQDPRIVKMPDGQVFHTITHGSPAQLMLGYGGQIPIPDRWAIVAYLRALQRARLATLDDVPAELRPQLLNPVPPTAATNK